MSSAAFFHEDVWMATASGARSVYAELAQRTRLAQVERSEMLLSNMLGS